MSPVNVREYTDASSFHCCRQHFESWIRISILLALFWSLLPLTAFRSDRNLRDSESVSAKVTCLSFSVLRKAGRNNARQAVLLWDAKQTTITSSKSIMFLYQILKCLVPFIPQWFVKDDNKWQKAKCFHGVKNSPILEIPSINHK